MLQVTGEHRDELGIDPRTPDGQCVPDEPEGESLIRTRRGLGYQLL